ncbi:ergothioneine biosynthesis protein EgtB [Arthrobacter echini]|uniref:Hercynine oxygenase n=1 Tax=Arthrobacter echini TaxID=1529066 RepID=A0A4S5E6H2_9MICC|nr:ergothioneine biosynthesis protein EgtB [Arthrobacter echini]THJ67060.1 ergothioneine biosynthesis protein EgtB [Arthrobacter echini]
MTKNEAPTGTAPNDLRAFIAEGLERARRRTHALTACDEEELLKQHSPLMSPLVWDLAHVGSQEEQWLVRDVGRMQPLRPEIDKLYDAFEHSRSSRPSLPLLAPSDSRSYLAETRSKTLQILERVPLEGSPLLQGGFAFGMMIQHEQQHAETMLATHQLRVGDPVLHPVAPESGVLADTAGALPAEVHVPAGCFTMGTSVEPWALDNERPAHEVYVPGYWIDTVPVSNGDFLAFMDDGGYSNPDWWTAEGWAHRNDDGLTAPKFWRREGGQWWRTRFGVVEPVPVDEPVQHVSFFEAEAYARWAGRRLPTEAEWEKTARYDPVSGRSRRYPWGDEDPTSRHANLGGGSLRPSPVGSYPAGASALGVRQLIGDVWEWTSSNFGPYPGFRVFPYREYSEVFFGGDYKVLRGGSWAADRAAVRGTFRNWDYPIRRQIFTGFRTARDAAPAGDS